LVGIAEKILEYAEDLQKRIGGFFIDLENHYTILKFNVFQEFQQTFHIKTF